MIASQYIPLVKYNIRGGGVIYSVGVKQYYYTRGDF